MKISLYIRDQEFEDKKCDFLKNECSNPLFN